MATLKRAELRAFSTASYQRAAPLSHSRSSSLLLPRHVADAIGTMPLLNLPRTNNNKHAARSASDPHILAGTSRTVFNIIKAFLGTAILFIPRGIRSAGLVAGAATLMTMAGLSTWAMLLLLRTRRHLETIGVAVCLRCALLHLDSMKIIIESVRF